MPAVQGSVMADKPCLLRLSVALYILERPGRRPRRSLPTFLGIEPHSPSRSAQAVHIIISPRERATRFIQPHGSLPERGFREGLVEEDGVALAEEVG